MTCLLEQGPPVYSVIGSSVNSLPNALLSVLGIGSKALFVCNGLCLAFKFEKGLYYVFYPHYEGGMV